MVKIINFSHLHKAKINWKAEMCCVIKHAFLIVSHFYHEFSSIDILIFISGVWVAQWFKHQTDGQTDINTHQWPTGCFVFLSKSISDADIFVHKNVLIMLLN